MSKRILPLALLLASTPAFAQAYVVGNRTEPFVPLANVPGANVTTFSMNDDDDGYSGAVPIGFPFSFFTSTFQNVYVSTNGFLSFGSLNDSFYRNTNFGNSASPNAIIAPVWYDLEIGTPSGSYATLGAAPNRIFVVEVSDFRPSFTTGDSGTWQVWLFEGSAGRIEVRLSGGPFTSVYAASVGFEGIGGANGTKLLTCTPSCSATDLNAAVGKVLYAFKPTGPELGASIGAPPRFVAPGSAAHIPLTVRNTGPVAATDVEVDLYLSTAVALDATATWVGTEIVRAPANGQATVTSTINVPAGIPVGDYFVFASVDPNNAIPEVIETDNVARSAQKVATGPDLAPTLIQATKDALPGAAIELDVAIGQNALPYSGPVTIETFASTDGSFDASDRSLGSFTVELTGTATATRVVGLVPADLAARTYFPVLVVDPDHQIAQTNVTNDVLVGSRSFATGSDFSVRTIAIPGQVPPGSNMQTSIEVLASGPPFFGDVELEVYASTDTQYDAADTLLGSYVAHFAGEASVFVNEAIPVSANLPADSYAVVVRVDPDNLIPELVEANNVSASAGRFLNSYDFRVSGVTAPTGAGAGDTIVIRANATSVGIEYADPIPYRIYFSLDNRLTQDDVAVADGTFTFPGAFSATITVPGTIQIGSYFVIVSLNPDGSIQESIFTNNWGSSSAAMRLQGADLRPNLALADEYGFSGFPISFSVTIANQGEAAARGFRYSARISDNDTIRINDPEIFLSEPIDLAAGAERTFEAQGNLPVVTATTTRFLGFLVDIQSAVAELQEGNNIRVVPHPIRVLLPIPNLSGELVATPAEAAAGERIAVTRLLQNTGVAASTFDYVYYLSTNSVISSDDVVIARDSRTIGPGLFDFGIDILQIPPGVAAGPYYVGIAMDPDSVVEEIDESDNAFTIGPIQIFGSAVDIRTTRLADATLGVPYEAGLYASGGPLGIQWTVSHGRLPNGLSLSTGGIVSGTPSEEGVFELTLRASSGTAFAERVYGFRVLAPTVPLAVATSMLPAALAGRRYEADLVAVGGVPPYDWTAVSGLPEGLTLSPAGVLAGTLAARGNFRISVRVRDALGDTAARDVVLNGINPDQVVSIVQHPLFAAIVGQEYCDPEPAQLEARGGTEPYRWFAVDPLPTGMNLSSSGQLCGIPAEVGTFYVRARVQDANNLFDTALVILEVEGGTELSISTTELAAATVGVPYEASLTGIRGTEPYAWEVAYGNLPAGLTLAENRISGTPTAAGDFAFAIRVTDKDKRTDTRPLSIIVAEAPKKDTTDEDGCSCETTRTSGSSPWMLLAVLVPLFLRAPKTRRALIALLGLAGATSFEATAFAQTPVAGTPYVMTRRAQTFTTLSNPTIVFGNGSDDEEVTVSLPFDFKFYDSTFSQVSMGVNGGIIFQAGASIDLSGPTPGSSSTPNGWVTAFWDDLEIDGQGSIGYQVFGTAPSRWIVFEWRNVNPYGEPSRFLNFQVAFYEGPSGKLVVSYGTPVGSSSIGGTIGMEDPAGARPVLFDNPPACSTNCGFTDLSQLANNQVEVIIDAGVEIVPLAISGPRYGFLGGQIVVPVTFASLHSNRIGPFKYAVDVVDGNTNHRIFESSERFLNAYEVVDDQPRVTVPAGLGTGEFKLRLVVDSSNQVSETGENNNALVSNAGVRLVPGRADVAVETVRVSAAEVTAGNEVSVMSRVTNFGATDIDNIAVAVVLSTNPVATAEDIELGRYSLSLLRGETVTSTTVVRIDSRLNSNVYYVGAFADADDQLIESDETNNGRVGSTLRVQGGSVAVATDALPAARKGAAYTAVLDAVGGDGRYTWAIASGTLPAGIGLVPGTGELFGRPSMEQSSTFTVSVTSAGVTATQELTLRVVDPATPLTIVTRRLPAGIVGQEYSQRIEVVGARTSSPAFSASGLPEGVMLTAGGLVLGTPTSAGTTTVSVTASDGQNQVTRDIPFRVRANSNLLIDLEPLEPAVFGEPYSTQFQASGGQPPYLWITRSTLPPGLTLSTGGVLSGTPDSVGSFRIEVEVRDAASVPALDTSVFVLGVNDVAGFTVKTTTLPVAYVNESFEASVESEGGEGPYDWTIEVGRLPKKLASEVLPSSGVFRIVGVPEAVGTTNLLVRVVDGHGRRAYQPLVLKVIERPVETNTNNTDEGCSCHETRSRGSMGYVLALALGVFFVRRRRRV